METNSCQKKVYSPSQDVKEAWPPGKQSKTRARYPSVTVTTENNSTRIELVGLDQENNKLPHTNGEIMLDKKLSVERKTSENGVPVSGGKHILKRLKQNGGIFNNKVSPLPITGVIQENVKNSDKINASAWHRAREKLRAQERDRNAPVIDQEEEAEKSALWKIPAVCRSKKFSNEKLEKLFQRYFFKLNQNNLMILMGFLCVICIMQILFYYVNGAVLPARAVNLAVMFVTFIVLEIICNKSTFDQQQMFVTSYIIIVLQLAIVVLLTVDTDPHSLSDGVWCTMLFIYQIYTLLPIRMRLSVLCGAILGLAQIVSMVVKGYGDDLFIWKQVIH